MGKECFGINVTPVSFSSICHVIVLASLTPAKDVSLEPINAGIKQSLTA